MQNTSRFGIGGAIMGAVFALIGLGILIHGMYLFSQAAASTSWPQADGWITTSRVKPSGGKESRPQPIVEYEYTVDGKPRQGNRVKAAKVTGFGGPSAGDIVRKYPVGKQVTVYYDPDQESFALLEPGLSASAFVQPGFGLAFLCAGLYFAWLSYREHKEAKVIAGM